MVMFHFLKVFSDISKNEFYGKDIKINFSINLLETFNEPRLYGNILESKNNSTIVSKGIFTTCKRDGCPLDTQS